MSNTTRPPFRLANPYFKSPTLKKGTFTIDATEHDYFFCHILAGPIGPKQAVMAILFHKLYEHCANVLKLPAIYDENGQAIIAEVLAKLNFNDPQQPPPGRRADPSPAKPARKPASGKREPRGTPSGSEKGAGASREASESKDQFNHQSFAGKEIP